MKNIFGVELEKLNPGRRVMLTLPMHNAKRTMHDGLTVREEAEVTGVMSNNGGTFVSVYVKRSDGSRARAGFDQIAAIVTTRKAKAA